MTEQLGGDVPLSTSEAHLDFLLAEELIVNQEFLRWFVEPLWERRFGGPPEGHLVATVALNGWDAGALDGEPSGGENDLDMVVTCGERTLRVLIEDKLRSEFQLDQCERYQRRATARSDGTALVAPRSRLDEHSTCFEFGYAIEDLADRLDVQASSSPDCTATRLRWRASVLRGLCTPARRVPKVDHPPTLAFAAFCTAWLATHEPRAVINPRAFRTRGSAWLSFDSHPGIVYKTARGYVDLHVRDHGFTGSPAELATAIAPAPGPEGFTVTVDTTGKPILRFEDPAIVVDPDCGVPGDVAGVETALQAVLSVVRWLDEGGAGAVLGRPGDSLPK